MWLTLLSNLPKLDWRAYLIAGLVLTNLFFFLEWRSTDTRLVKEHNAHLTDIASFKQAQADADKAAKAQRDSLLKESKANADQADINYSGLLTQYHASLLRYSASKSASSQPDHYQLPTAQGSDGPSASTNLPPTITITGSDAQICAVNTARLVAVHDWAVSLKKDSSLEKVQADTNR